MKSKWWAIALLSVVAFAPSFLFGGLTAVWMASPEFRESIDCWLDPNNGTWMTPNEGHYIGISIFGVGGLVLSLLVWAILDHAKTIRRRTSVLILIGSVVLSIAVFLANLATNDAYIDRLYEACARVN